MTPDAKIQIFAIKRGMMEKRSDVNYYLPEYRYYTEKLLSAHKGKMHKISDFSDVICGPFGSAIKNTDYKAKGVPLLRITNITPEGTLDYENIKFISKELSESLDRTRVSQGDIVLSQRGSLGLFAIVDDRYDILNISANLIAIKNIKNHSPEFVKNYLNSRICKKLLARCQSGQIQCKITTSDISEILIPSETAENDLNEIIANGYRIYKQKLQQAEELLAGMDEFIAQRIGFSNDTTHTRSLCWGVQKSRFNSRRLDALFYQSSSNAKYRQITRFHLSEIASINGNSKSCIKFPEEVPYIGLPECTLGTISSVRIKKYKDVCGRNVAIPGDILFARIEPSIFNKKYVWGGNLRGHDWAFLSTEFYTIRAKNSNMQKFLYAMLFFPSVYKQFCGKTVGSTGRRRIDRRSLEEVIIPVPRIEICKEIGDEFFIRRKKADEIRSTAERKWQESREQFEKELLGE